MFGGVLGPAGARSVHPVSGGALHGGWMLDARYEMGQTSAPWRSPICRGPPLTCSESPFAHPASRIPHRVSRIASRPSLGAAGARDRRGGREGRRLPRLRGLLAGVGELEEERLAPGAAEEGEADR